MVHPCNPLLPGAPRKPPSTTTGLSICLYLPASSLSLDPVFREIFSKLPKHLPPNFVFPPFTSSYFSSVFIYCRPNQSSSYSCCLRTTLLTTNRCFFPVWSTICLLVASNNMNLILFKCCLQVLSNFASWGWLKIKTFVSIDSHFVTLSCSKQ